MINIRFKSIGSRIVFWFLLSASAILFIAGIFFYSYVSGTILDKESQKIATIRDLKIREINSWIDRIRGDLHSIAKTDAIGTVGFRLCRKEHVSSRDLDSLNRLFDSYLNNYNIYYEFFLISGLDGKVVFSTIRDHVGADRSKHEYFVQPMKNEKLFIRDIYYSSNLNIPTMTVSLPVESSQFSRKSAAGVLVARIYLERSLYNLLLDRGGLGYSGESIIVNTNLVALNRLRGYDGFPLTMKLKDQASQTAVSGKSGLMECKDYRGRRVLAAYRFLPQLNWGIVVKQDISEIMRPFHIFFAVIAVFFGLSILMIFITGRSLGRNISRPVKSFITVANRIKEGQFDFRNRSNRDDEFLKLNDSFNTMADLIISQLQVQRVSSEIIHVMVSTLSLEEFSRNVLKKLVEISESSLGAFYFLSSDGREFKHLTSIGLDVESLETFHAGRLEGEFGKALATREIALTRKISDSSMIKLRTIIGDLVPNEIMTIPIIVNNRTVAIVSLASLTEFAPEVLKILDQVRPVMNTAFSNILSDEETRRLAKELADKNQLLESQKGALMTQAAELRRQSEKVRKQNIELESQRQKVEEANKLKSEFLSNMSHELRTPLNSILALSHVLLLQTKGKLTDEELGYLEVIDRNGAKLLTLINDILDLSKIEAGRIDLKVKLLSLINVIGIIADNHEQITEDKGIGLKVVIDGDIPEIESDESRVYQIFQNIIGNAVKFTDQGGVTVRLSALKESVSVVVEDSGIGIDPGDLPHIFEEFRQIDGTLSRKYDGTGLGLAIASKSARLISGEINVQSRPGKGSRFEVLLPITWKAPSLDSNDRSVEVEVDRRSPHVTVSTNNDISPQRDFDLHPENKENSSPSVLVVDDDSDNILAVKAILQDRFTVHEAYDGNRAIEMVYSVYPDLILLDMALPGKSGFEVVKEIKENRKTRHIPTVAITALTMAGDRERVLEAGCDDYIPKPFNVKELVEKIHFWLSDHNEQDISH